MQLNTQHVRCRFCSKFRHPHEFVAGHIVGPCFRCYESHQVALDSLASGAPPRECPHCQTRTELLPRDANGDLRLRMHVMDGTIAFLCQHCSDVYESKRRDQFANTPYGAQKQLGIRT